MKIKDKVMNKSQILTVKINKQMNNNFNLITLKLTNKLELGCKIGKIQNKTINILILLK